ncbi:DUF4265 domain-containing protein [Kribbella sp. C-35]|uniref:DUF4265 domain-containing protein n=1 Tax=Kribbella sp. C-35 TaxID=2789276 RepID=UPI00397B5AC6
MKFIVHHEPALRADSNYIARIALAPFGFDGEAEQVWLRRTAHGVGTMCCIPFRAYGVALGDTVHISPDGATVTQVVARSGRRVLRALVVEPDPAGAAAELEEHIARAGLRIRIERWPACGDRCPTGCRAHGVAGLPGCPRGGR